MHVTNGDHKHFVRYIAQYLADAFASSRRYSPTAPSPNCSSWFQGSSSAIILCLNACVIFAQEQLSDIKNNTNWSNTSVYRQGFVPRSARPSVFTSAFCKLPMKLEMKIMPSVLVHSRASERTRRPRAESGTQQRQNPPHNTSYSHINC